MQSLWLNELRKALGGEVVALAAGLFHRDHGGASPGAVFQVPDR